MGYIYLYLLISKHQRYIPVFRLITSNFWFWINFNQTLILIFFLLFKRKLNNRKIMVLTMKSVGTLRITKALKSTFSSIKMSFKYLIRNKKNYMRKTFWVMILTHGKYLYLQNNFSKQFWISFKLSFNGFIGKYTIYI